MTSRKDSTSKKLHTRKDICTPINDLEEALKYTSISVDASKCHVFLKNNFVIKNSLRECHQELSKLHSKQRLHNHSVPKTLVCHDMKGGYLEDKYVNGCNIGNGYTFYRWSNIDIFVYFSHHFVTIPPTGWVKVAHRNNVKILGTVITEGDTGLNICNAILKSNEVWQDFAKSLINICLLNSFDGWLLNIENKITNTKALVDFVSFLTQEMRKVNPEFIVLWYDSVIKSGKLEWQNELNDFNKCFFDACDGIFLNYTWKDLNLERSALKAQHRILDVFVGIDVFGRNCFGGGGFNSYAAASLIRKQGMSIAIFAPGWTHETLNSRENFFDTYCRRDNAFWLNLYPYLYTHPITKSFTTTFHLGSDEKSFNLNNQEIVSTRPAHSGKNNSFKDNVVEICDCIQLHHEGCTPNTKSYLISTSCLNCVIEYVHKLFTCNIRCTKNLVVATIVKQVEGKNGTLNIIVLTKDRVGRSYSFRLLSENQKIDYNNEYDVPPMTDSNPMTPIIKKCIRFKKVASDWSIKYYFLTVPVPMDIMEVGVIVIGNSILVGGFSVQADFYVSK